MKQRCPWKGLKIIYLRPFPATMKFVLLIFAFLTGMLSWAQTPIDREEVIQIGGIKQYITLKGRDRSKPLFLFLHGGPGGSVISYAQNFTRKLQEHFVVVQWDQRETGETLKLNSSNVPLSLSVFQQDTHELIDTLLKRFQREKLYLAAHSWGTALGFYMAKNYPQLLFAYIPIGPMINQLESERIVLNMMKEKAQTTGNQKEIAELSLVKIPFGDGAQLYYHRKWLQDLSGSRKQLSRSYVESWSSTWLQVFNEASRDNLFETLPSIGCPVYFFAGRKDLQTNSGIVETYYKQLKAPKKALFWFENSGHSIPSSEPGRLQDLIIEKILPGT